MGRPLFTMHPLLIFIALIFLAGCIEPYHPGEGELKTGTVVVLTHLHNKPGMQYIHLSRSSTLIYPEYEPISGCYVKIENEFGEVREFRESQPGTYCGILEEEFLKTGIEYRINFFTMEGDEYISEFEKMFPAPEIVSLYFEKEDHSTRDPEIIEEGIQFYLDFEIEKDSGRYLNWQLTETYEIHNPENPAWIYDLDRRVKELPDTSTWYRCWITNEIPEIFTLDVGNVEGKVYRRMPLNYVTNETRRLQIRYSLLVKQLATSPGTYHYWNELKKNLQDQGNLFDEQPSLTPGNICNVNDEDEVVIGYFSISGLSESRVFAEEVPGLDIEVDPLYCVPGEFPRFLSRFRDQYLPIYFSEAWVFGEWRMGEVQKHCVDCRDYKGSTHIKPDFW
jgi:hypothetical protein